MQFTVGGEPLTTARVAEIKRAGAAVTSRYASIETSQIAYGCLAPKPGRPPRPPCAHHGGSRRCNGRPTRQRVARLLPTHDHASLGPLDPDAVAKAFLAAIGAGSDTDHMMALLWRDASFMGVNHILEAPGFTNAERRAMFGEIAAKLLGIKLSSVR